MDKSRPRPQKGPSEAFPPSGNRLCRASHRASTSLAPYGLPAPCHARHKASSIVTSPTGTALISAPQRGVKGAIAPTAPEREPKNAPAKAGENSPRGNCVPPCRATASPSHRTRPPLWACGPPIRLEAVGSPCWLSRKECLNPPRCAQEKENRLPGLPGGPGRGDQSCGQG